MMIKGKGLINPTVEEVIEFLGDRFIEVTDGTIWYSNIYEVRFGICEDLSYMDEDTLVTEHTDGSLYVTPVKKGSFKRVDEYETTNDEPVNIIPEIKAGTEPQRVLAEDGTENQENEILTECVVREELERRNMMLENVKRLENTVDRLLDIVEGVVKRGEL